jgi:hypothetical protein
MSSYHGNMFAVILPLPFPFYAFLQAVLNSLHYHRGSLLWSFNCLEKVRVRYDFFYLPLEPFHILSVGFYCSFPPCALYCLFRLVTWVLSFILAPYHYSPLLSRKQQKQNKCYASLCKIFNPGDRCPNVLLLNNSQQIYLTAENLFSEHCKSHIIAEKMNSKSKKYIHRDFSFKSAFHSF